MTTNIETKTFQPRPSTGWAWITIIALIPLSVGLTLIMRFGFSGPMLPMILIATPIGIGFLIIAVFFPTMKYEMDNSSLTLSYGPLLHDTIRIKDIKSIRRCNLGFSPVSSFRFPGLAIFRVHYPNVGLVKMCATAASNDILLIETDSNKYGITPADEPDFVAELRKRIES